MIKNKKKFTTENDFLKDDFIFNDEDDFNNHCENDLYIEDEHLEEDIKFIEFLRKNMEYPIAPQEIIEKAMEGYTKHYRYQIEMNEQKKGSLGGFMANANSTATILENIIMLSIERGDGASLIKDLLDYLIDEKSIDKTSLLVKEFNLTEIDRNVSPKLLIDFCLKLTYLVKEKLEQNLPPQNTWSYLQEPEFYLVEKYKRLGRLQEQMHYKLNYIIN